MNENGKAAMKVQRLRNLALEVIDYKQIVTRIYERNLP